MPQSIERRLGKLNGNVKGILTNSRKERMVDNSEKVLKNAWRIREDALKEK